MRRHKPRQNRSRPNRRSRKPILFIGGLFVGALVWFAPTIVVKSPLKDRILKSATSDFKGTVSVGSMSAGWLSPLTAQDVVALDPQGERIAEIESVCVEKSLVSLIGDRTELGKIQITRPVVNLIVRGDGSNLEDAIAEYMKPSDSSGSLGIEIAVADGTVNVIDAASGEKWSASGLEVGVVLPKESNDPITLGLDTALTTASGKPGHLKGDLQWQRDATDDAGLGKGNLSLQATLVPIELSTAAARRFAPGLAAAGILDGDVRLDWGPASQSVDVSNLAVRNLDLVAPQWIGQDRLQLDSITASGKVTHESGGWEAEQVAIASDLGRFQTTGTAVVNQSGSLELTEELLAALRYGKFRVDGHVDLARLARMMPQTLHVREGTNVTGGLLTFGLVSSNQSGVQRWDSEITASGLSARHQGRPIALTQPIVVAVAAQEANQEINIEKFACESSFLNVKANGSSAAGAATLSGDFSRLAAELSKFIDLGGMQLAGKMNAVVDWQKTDEHMLQVGGSGTVREFELVAADQRPWREKNLAVAFSGVGRPGQQSLQAIDGASLVIQSEGDELELRMPRPKPGTVRGENWFAVLKVKGELRSWLARLQPLVTVPGWNVDGAVDLKCAGLVSKERVDISEADVSIDDLRANNGSLFVNERKVQIKSRGVWEQATSTFTSPDTTFASSTLAFRASDVFVQTAKPNFAGTISYRGDVGRMFALIQDPNQPATWRLAGDTTGQVAARYNQGVTTAEWSSEIKQFAYLTRPTAPLEGDIHGGRELAWDETWQEPQLKLGATVVYDPTADAMKISKLEAIGDTIGVAAKGEVKELATQCLTDVQGQISYDLQKLSTRFQSQLGDGFRISGRDSRPFSFRGPLLAGTNAQPGNLQPVSLGSSATSNSLSGMLAQASLGWNSASVQGFAIGAGELDARLGDGVLNVDAVDLPVSEGKVRLHPTIRLDGNPMVMTLPRGPVIEKVRISPEMCGTWLKYVTPLAAGATSAQGRFSASLEGATIPLNTPTNGDIEGKLEIHEARLGPGPVAQQLLLLADIVKAAIDGKVWEGTGTIDKTWLDLPAQQVAFRMVDNRVYHDGLQVQVDDVVVRTRGSVGMDQTLSMMAEVPVRDEWLSRSKWLRSLRGQSIQVPLHGTLQKPQLDRNAVAQITKQAVIGAGTNIIQEEAAKGLNKLLGRGLEELGLPIGQ